MIKKLNKYLLENYPLLYHTKLPYIAVVGILLWLFSMGCGFLYFSKAVHVERSIDSLYLHSSFVILHITLLIIILSIWLMKFYRDNPLKHYFPLQKWYYTRILLHVFTGLLILISAKIPFDYGVQLKYKHIFELNKIPEDITLFKLSEPFLVKEYKNLYLSEKQFPKPFPLEGFVKSSANGEWYKVNSNLYSEYNTKGVNSSLLYYNPKYYDNDGLKSGYANENLFPEILDQLETTLIDGDEFIFYKKASLKVDTCSSTTVISSFVDVNHIPNLNKYSLYNYSDFSNQANNLYYNNTDYALNPKSSLGELLHGILDGRDEKQVSKLLSDFNKRLDFYEIPNNIQPKLMAKYLVQKEFKNFDFNLVRDAHRGSYLETSRAYPNRKFSEIEQTIQNEELFLDSYMMELCESNYEDVLDGYYLEGWFIFINIAFYLSLLIIWFEFTELKPFLLSIPTAGLISVIFGGFISLTSFESKTILLLLSAYVIIIYLIGFYLIRSNQIKKFYGSISINILFVLTIIIGIIILFTIEENVLEWKVNNCSQQGYYDQKYKGMTNPTVLFFMAVLSIIPFFNLVKRWKAKKN